MDYKAVMVDQPEIHFSADSEYRGMKPEDIAALASIMRETATEKLEAGNYKVVEQPGKDVLFVRVALTELYLKKKKRGVLAYTPIGAVAKVGTDALKETLDKLDIIEMTFEAELADSMSRDVLAATRRPKRRTQDGRSEGTADGHGRVPRAHQRVCVAPALPAGQRQAAQGREYRLHRSKGPPGA